MDKIEQLKVFCLVAEKLSFAQVAKQMAVPRSTITYAIQSLEKEYEVLLFYRTTRKVSLTYEGQLFYEETTRLIEHLKELNRFKYQIRHQQGKISIGLPKRMASEVFIPHLPEFYAKHPQVKILINSGDSFSNLIEQQLDCVIRVGLVNDEYLIQRPIADMQLISLASPDYLMQFGEPTQLDDLAQHFAVDYHVGKSHSKYSYLDFLDCRVKVPYRILVEDTEAYIQAGISGLGIIQIPAFDGQHYIAQGKLKPILSHIKTHTLPVTMLLADRKYRPQYFQDFIDWLEALLKVQTIQPE